MHIADGALIEAVHDSAIEYPPEVSETEMLGPATVPSLHVKPPRLAAAPIAMDAGCANASNSATRAAA